MDEQRYEIQEGVQRSKAAWLCGYETIPAQVNGFGTVINVPLKSLLSPKPIIETNGPRGADWGVIYRMNSNFFDSVIRAIHRVITSTRTLAYFNADSQQIARILDYADPLGSVPVGHFPAATEEERIALFRQRLQDIEDTFLGFEGLVASFDQNMKREQPQRELMTALAA